MKDMISLLNGKLYCIGFYKLPLDKDKEIKIYEKRVIYDQGDPLNLDNITEYIYESSFYKKPAYAYECGGAMNSDRIKYRIYISENKLSVEDIMNAEIELSETCFSNPVS